MADWATKRKNVYSLIILGVIILGAGLPTYLFLYKKPTCTDGIKNGGEKGVDCGGICTKLCSADFSGPVYIWERLSHVSGNVYNVIAYVENPNVSVEAPLAPYSFRLYDNNGVLITERKGAITIPSGKKFAVFEQGIITAEKTPVKVTFEFIGQPKWAVSTKNVSYKTSGVAYDMTGGFPRVNGLVINTTRDTYQNLDAIVLLYDTDGNIIDFSKTVIDELKGEDTAPVVFTWPTALRATPAKIDILVQKRDI